MRCGPGYSCALVRHGQGKPVPDCITMEEAVLLEQAVRGSIRSGTSVGVPNRADMGVGIPALDRAVVGQPFFSGVLQPIVNVGDFIQQIGLLRAQQSPFIQTQRGGLFSPRFTQGVPIPLGIDKLHPLGFGSVSSEDAGHAAVGIINPGGMGPAVIEDRSRQIQLNININNSNVNQNIHRGSVGTQINNSPTDGCSSNQDCPTLTQCCHHVCSKTCTSTNRDSAPVEKPLSPQVV